MQIVEGLVFAAEEALPEAEIAGVYTDVTGEPWPDTLPISTVVERLNERYAEAGCVFRIHHWAGGFRMATEPLVEPFLRALFAEHKQRRLSRALLESLAVVAYRQPVAKPVVDLIRGVDSDYALRRLLEFGLVEIVGRSDAIGRPLLYGTTPRFLDAFGLADLDELPSLLEIGELVGELHLDPEQLRLLEETTHIGFVGPTESEEASTGDDPDPDMGTRTPPRAIEGDG